MLNERNNIRFNLTFACFLTIIICALIMPDTLFAESGGTSIDTVVDKFKSVFNNENSNQITSFLLARAKVIFYFLALIQFGWNLSQMAMEGRLEIQSVILAATRQLLVIGIMYWFLTNAQTLFGNIIDGFDQAGKSLDSSDGTVSSIIQIGVNTVTRLFASLKEARGRWWAKLPEYIVVGICSVIILVSFAFAALTFIIAQCKVYMSAMIATFFMGFGANDYTRNIAITAFKGVFCAVIELFVLHVLFGLAKEVFTSFFNDVEQVELSGIMLLAAQLVIATFVYTSALKTLPQFASGIIMGSPMGGGSAMGSGQALAGAISAVASMAATGAMTAGGTALGGAGAMAAAKAAGAGKLETMGQVMSGMAKGAYGAKTGQMRNIMSEAGKNAILGGLNAMQNSPNSMSAPSNPNNVSPD